MTRPTYDELVTILEQVMDKSDQLDALAFADSNVFDEVAEEFEAMCERARSMIRQASAS
ncbi:MAG: hypothetical protein ACK52I_29295 [Pseudomonadota bacterium]